MNTLPPRDLERIRAAYQHRTWLDQLETVARKTRESILGVDGRIFDPTIRYYRETKGVEVSREEALERALNKKRHKDMWFQKDRRSIDDIREFYQEADVYPFRQPFNKRLGGYRWYAELVAHIEQPSILEYGCGSAILTEYLLARFPRARYTVADIPSTTLEFVKWKKAAYGHPYDILTIGVGRDGIPLRSNFDLVICQDVLEHTPNPLEIVEVFIERLSVGGVLVLDFLNAPGGENLPAAVEQREAVKERLQAQLEPLKAIDEGGGNNGLYVKTRAVPTRSARPVEESEAVLAP